MIFAREVSGPLTSLVKKIDEATGKNSAAQMGSFIVYCSDDDKLENQLKELATKEKLKNIVLAIDGPTGPAKYKLAQDADITVVLYNDHKVEANFVFKKGQLDDKAVEKIVGEFKKIVPAK
jgi:hypothetical protein